MKHEDENACPAATEQPHDIAAYILESNGGDAIATVDTRGWVPDMERKHG